MYTILNPERFIAKYACKHKDIVLKRQDNTDNKISDNYLLDTIMQENVNKKGNRYKYK